MLRRLAPILALSLAPALGGALHSQTATGAAPVRTPSVHLRMDTSLAFLMVADQVTLLLDQMRSLRLISTEMEKLVRELEENRSFRASAAPAWVGPTVVRSLQDHARSAVVTIKNVCSDAEPIRRGYVGIQLEESVAPQATVSRAVAAAAPPEYPRVVRVEGGSPASRAGLVPGDRIVSANGSDLRGRTLSEFVSRPGEVISLRVRRGERELSTQVVLGRAPEPVYETCNFIFTSPDMSILLQNDSLMASRLRLPSLSERSETRAVFAVRSGESSPGVIARALTLFGAHFANIAMARSTVNTDSVRGAVRVLSVQENSVADRGGLRRMDIVTRVGGRDVQTVDELRAAIDSSAWVPGIVFEVLRDGRPATLTVRLREEPR